MSKLTNAGTFALGHRTVSRMGYGAMQLAGPGVFGPPKEPAAALAVLREAVASGVNHIDTSDFYGPHVTNRLIREALHPYPDDLVIVTKVGAVRGADASWNPAQSPAELVSAVHDNLRNLGVDALDVVNLRVMTAGERIADKFAVLAELQEQGLIRHLGVSNVDSAQVAEAQRIAPVVCVQNMYSLADRSDDRLLDECAEQGIAYVPFFPLGSAFQPFEAAGLEIVADRRGVSIHRVALAWLLHRSPNILVIPGSGDPAHVADNVAAAALVLTDEDLAELGAS